MPITRTAWIDDDGSGQTGSIINNAEKTILYNQIDGLVVPFEPVYSGWTPADGSGVGLIFTVTGARYTKIGRVVFIWCHLNYPGNANSAEAKIGGLPAANSTDVIGGFYTMYGVNQQWTLASGANVIRILSPTTFNPRLNSEMSGLACAFSGAYYTSP